MWVTQTRKTDKGYPPITLVRFAGGLNTPLASRWSLKLGNRRAKNTSLLIVNDYSNLYASSPSGNGIQKGIRPMFYRSCPRNSWYFF